VKKYTNSETFRPLTKEEVSDVYDLDRERLDDLRRTASELSRESRDSLDSDTE
jgi:hypothetical protein